MRNFSHVDAASAKEASSNASKSSALFIAGGTDLLGTLKDEILPSYPEKVINLKTIGGMDGIRDEGGAVLIGALAKISALAESDLAIAHATALAQACEKVASPTIRNMATIGGNICQMHRCWYFRVPDNRFACRRKGGNYCPARIGDNRYHSIYGEQDGCYAASSHDTAPALIALGATISTTKRKLAAEDFFVINGIRSNALEADEVVTEISVPKAAKSAFQKFALRKSIDFPLVNCAAARLGDDSVCIALGGVYPSPVRIQAAEAAVAGGITEASAQSAADAAVAECRPLPKSGYKVEIARALVKRTLMELK
ncbi:MAG: FAD binding domain-containing protein [Eggerthellaceae bacterium]|jgi:xanthine dehydrogenase YagS FAD-binding subunit|nr:FAD binding domain-containing protein [Eggerthellaceae bacterium]MDR2716135.1 FAD binding domain-containing protein [Coriobacteriaceae bacterium]